MDEPIQDAASPGEIAPGSVGPAGASDLQDELALVQPHRELTREDIASPPRRRMLFPLALFLTACVTTFQAGATNSLSPFNVREGIIYAAAVLGILLCHEMGHFLQTVRYGVPSTFPLFIPVPTMTGTMGAVIMMDGSKANRKQLFDIGISGPLAGLVVALPVTWFAIKNATPIFMPPAGTFSEFGDPLIFKLFAAYLHPEMTDKQGFTFVDNPLLLAGWVGMLITGLNMMPISQLDGGHVIYGLFGKRAHWIARAFVIFAVGFIVGYELYVWILMLVLVLLMGVDHPPTSDDSVELGFGRRLLGLASLAIPVFCFAPFIRM